MTKKFNNISQRSSKRNCWLKSSACWSMTMQNRTSARNQARKCSPMNQTTTNNNLTRFCFPFTTRQSKRTSKAWCLCLTLHMATYLMKSVVSLAGKAWLPGIWACLGMVPCISRFKEQSRLKKRSRKVSFLAEVAFILDSKTLKTTKINPNPTISGLNTPTKLIKTLRRKWCRQMLLQHIKCFPEKSSPLKHK